MRIAFISNYFPILSQTFVLNQITGMIECGHEVEIFAARPRAFEKAHRDVVNYSLCEKTFYWPESRRQTLRALGSAIKKLPPREQLALLARILQTLGPSSPAVSWLNRQALAKRALVAGSRRPYDVIVAHFGPSARIAQMLREVGALQGKLVAVFHAYDLTSYVKEHGPEVYQRLFTGAERVLSISEFWRSRLLQLGCSAERIQVHRMGIDCSQFEFRERRPGISIRLVTIARFVEKKGISYALQAIARLVGTYPSLEYHLVGDGPLRPDIEARIAQLNLSSHVVLHGWEKQEVVADILDDMHIMIAPSVTAANGDMEGIPVAIMEAMARGLPVISTLHGGIPELVEYGQTGLLIKEKDVDALVMGLRWLIENPGSWKTMGRAGREKVEREFNISNLNDRFEKLLADVINEDLC